MPARGLKAAGRHGHAPHDHLDVAMFTSDQVQAINRFPDDNPNPVLRIDPDGHLLYANPASAPILRTWGARVGQPLAKDVVERLAAVTPSHGFVEVVADNRTYAVWPVPIEDMNFTNLYGTDVTAERAIVKFPDQNPNPVFRIHGDGLVVYANRASSGLLEGLGLGVGSSLPGDLREALVAIARSGEQRSWEIESDGRAYALLAVDVPEFGFINVYGTDITAVRERERLAEENERLLLNVLPEPIARRLREGEALIADRFDDVTLLFADIVEFTQLSASLSPNQLVGVLNETFTVFDQLVDRFGLEKVKTIGDAYMVVGGMPERSDDHADRVAAMAIELTDAVGRIDAAARLGISFRIGINCGPVVAGVIGTKKFIYDVWGDTVNMASRMESLGVPGRIHVSPALRDRLVERFEFESRGVLDVKGKGPTQTYFLVGRRGAHAPSAEEGSAAGASADGVRAGA